MLIASHAIVSALSALATWAVLALPDWYARREFEKLGGPAVWVDPKPTNTQIVIGGQTFNISR
jgi:hypothetical protein